MGKRWSLAESLLFGQGIIPVLILLLACLVIGLVGCGGTPEVVKGKVVNEAHINLKPLDVFKDGSVYLQIEKYINGKWEKKTTFIRKGEAIGRDDLRTNYVLHDIQEYTKEIQINPDDPSKCKTLIGWQVFFKHRLTGEIISKPTRLKPKLK